MSKINKVLYNVDQTPDTSEDERRLARKNIGLDEVIGIQTSERETGIAPLGVDGKVPAAYLPSYVDDVIDGYYHDGVFYSDDQYTTAITPERGKIYVDVTAGGNSASYRWDANGNQYVQMSAQDTYANVAFKGIGASTATTIAATQVSDTIQFTSGAGIDLSRVGNNKEVKIDVAFGNTNANRSVTLDDNGKATATSLATDSPTVPGSGTTTALSFIDTVSQDSRGKITATKKNVNVDSTYSASGTNPVNGTAVSKALETLGVNDISGLSDALAAKQDTLTAGNNVRIDNNVISATDTTYTAGSGLQLNSTTFSVDTTTIQPKLTAGANITIDANNKISAADTTYSAGTGLQLNSTTFSVDTTTIQSKLTAGTNITIDSSNKISATKSDWNASVGADGEILNKPVVIEGQINLQLYGTKQFKNLTIDNSDLDPGTLAPVSVTSTEDTTYTPGYLVTPAGSANKYLRSDTDGVPEWDDLDMGSFDEYYVTPDGYEGKSEPLSKITVEKYENGNSRIKFNNESSYKYLVPPPSPNRQLVTNSSGVMQWDTINANLSFHEIVLSERNDTQADSAIYNYVSDDVENGKTPMLWSGDNYGNRYFYIFKRRTGGSPHSNPTTFLFEGNETAQNRIIRKLITSGTITTQVVPLQGRLTAGSGIAIDSNTNEIMCTGTGQVVDGVFKQVDSGSTRYTIQFGIGNQNNQFLDLVKTNTATSPNSTISATHINEEEVQSHFIKVKAKESNYIGKFWASQSDTIPGQATPNASSSIRQLSTALHSVYDGTLSGTPGSQEVPIDRVTLYGNTNHSYDDNNLGNLTVGTLAMRIINASSTNPSHQLLASCVKGEIDLINVNNAEELHTLTSDSSSSYIGVAANDCMLMVTTNPRKCTDAVARTKQAGDSDLGSIVMFPSKAYIDDHIEKLDDIYLKKSYVSTAHVRLKTDTTYSNGNTSIMSTTLTVAGNGAGTYDLQPIARKADRNGLISITITSLSPGKKCIMSVLGHASGESGFNTLLRFGGESDTALELYSYSATVPVIYNWSTYGGSFNISINNHESSAVKYLIQVTAISGPCDYYP